MRNVCRAETEVAYLGITEEEARSKANEKVAQSVTDPTTHPWAKRRNTGTDGRSKGRHHAPRQSVQRSLES